MHDPAAPWLFPVPTRPSRFTTAPAGFAFLNREVDLGRIPPFGFDAPTVDDDLLHYDYQTQLEHNAPGRLGAGRAGVFGGWYVKGVGRTPAAANWNTPGDRYHASGHLSVSSALRERLITQALTARGLGDALVPCAAVLLGDLTAAEQISLTTGHTSSRPDRPADMRMLALSAKPADFARQSNIVWALDHFAANPASVGGLFLALEQALAPPGDPAAGEGDPREIAEAMSRAFTRGLTTFERFATEGVYWTYLQNNFTLDGRYVDLETPLYFGGPLLGMRHFRTDGRPDRSTVGFESFGYVVQWRLFVRALRAKLRLLNTRAILPDATSRLFLRAVAAELDAMFTPAHLLYQDDVLVQREVAALAQAHDLGPTALAELGAFTRDVFVNAVRGVDRALPTRGWTRFDAGIDTPTVAALVIDVPPYLRPTISPAAAAYTERFVTASRLTDPEALLAAVG
jgi:hypothetical protein